MLLFKKTIKDRFKHCTVLTIAHRLATLKDSDLIIVMKDCLIKDQGTPKTTKCFTKYNNVNEFSYYLKLKKILESFVF